MYSTHPRIIQGGMGAGVSNWRLARAVAQTGQLGVVSGTALDQILARRLQDGDPGGHMRRGLDHFPFPEMAKRIWETYFIPGGKPAGASYKNLAVHTKDGPRDTWELCIVSNFVEVFLAREGHCGLVGINYLEKVQLPHLSSIYGAMLAGVHYILMGAGIPLKIPGVLDSLSRHEQATYPLLVSGAQEGDDTTIRFEPRDFMERDLPPLARPVFLAIIASNTLATTMLKKANGRVDGFVIEGPTAGGHNAPPRGKQQLNATGEPIYGERDLVDLEKLRELNTPFWLAGGYGRPGKLREALDAGAAGVQTGTIFEFCAESGLSEEYKQSILKGIFSGEARVLTDPLASPTGFPFKVVQVDGSASDPTVYAERRRVCDVGYLREAYRTPDGKIGYRCAAEPVTTYVAKGGKLENTVGRKCLCNGLLANIAYPQVRRGNYVEKGLVTAGDDLAAVARYMPSTGRPYTAAEVVSMLLDEGSGRHCAVRASDCIGAAAAAGVLAPA
ncbi:MAG TPA: nitronate monooxygenase [Bryobacteraceae bacterium]|nr:nitronate monooxygenase [Bryobacteraceae bacterium]